MRDPEREVEHKTAVEKYQCWSRNAWNVFWLEFKKFEEEKEIDLAIWPDKQNFEYQSKEFEFKDYWAKHENKVLSFKFQIILIFVQIIFLWIYPWKTFYFTVTFLPQFFQLSSIFFKQMLRECRTTSLTVIIFLSIK